MTMPAIVVVLLDIGLVLVAHQSALWSYIKHLSMAKEKKVESHSIENIEDIETNNALVLHTAPINEVSLVPVKAKLLEISNFLKDEMA